MIPIRPMTVVLTVVFQLAICRMAIATELDCFIAPSLIANVGSEVAGLIVEVVVDRGDFVKKGQMVAKLDSKVEEATMELKQAKIEYLTREHKRKNDLFAKGVISFQEIDEAETNLKIASRELDEITQILERRKIRSPLDGVVVERLLSPGERVEEKPILKLVRIDPLYAEIYAPARLLGNVRVGDRALIKPEPPGKGEYIGRVKVVDRVVEAASGTFGIRVELKNSNFTLPAGLKCQVRFLGK